MAKGIQSILLGFRLLRGITDSDTPVSLKSIAAAAGMSPSKARMYLISLIETGLVVQKAETGFYALGPYALHLGTRALQRMELMAVATEEMRNLQRKTNALVLLCTWDVKGVMIVSRSEGSRPQPLQFTIGGSASLANTATGHIFLAFGPQQQTWTHLAEELLELGLTKTEQRKRMQTLTALAEQVRRRGVAEANPIAYSSGVTLSGYAAIAAPIFDSTERLRYVLTLIYRTDRPPKKKEDLVRLTRQGAGRVTELGGARIKPRSLTEASAATW
jgi:DNA-binding IclR family transcriptional regulator